MMEWLGMCTIRVKDSSYDKWDLPNESLKVKAAKFLSKTQEVELGEEEWKVKAF